MRTTAEKPLWDEGSSWSVSRGSMPNTKERLEERRELKTTVFRCDKEWDDTYLRKTSNTVAYIITMRDLKYKIT